MRFVRAIGRAVLADLSNMHVAILTAQDIRAAVSSTVRPVAHVVDTATVKARPRACVTEATASTVKVRPRTCVTVTARAVRVPKAPAI